MSDSPDRALRAMTDDGAFRVIVATTTDTVARTFAAQSPSGATARHFGDLITGTVLVRETMSPYHRVQGILKGAGGKGSLVVDTHPDGATRGLVQPPKGGAHDWLGTGSVLQVMRTMATGRVYRGVVQPKAGADVSAALMTYLQDSEQVVAVIATGTVLEGARVHAAGGFVVQLLPEAPRGSLMIMTERLERFPAVTELLTTSAGSPRKLVEEILYGMPFTALEERPIAFGCQCSQQAVVASLATLGRAELVDMLREREPIEVSCDDCHTTYPVGRVQLAGLLHES
ncbi:MAG: Hsp33 family molecular chaperone HslO [Polyangiaceae bacterium]|nr:Hsp33 family molecular chaperone HslO [Polyangiaceae bacterium]